MPLCLHNSVREVHIPEHRAIFMAMLATNIRVFGDVTTEDDLARLQWAVVDPMDIRRANNETFILDDRNRCIVIS